MHVYKCTCIYPYIYTYIYIYGNVSINLCPRHYHWKMGSNISMFDEIRRDKGACGRFDDNQKLK